MNTRKVALLKPHIFHTYRGWACCKSQTWIGWDCGHYRSTGSASHLRFHEDNAHGQRKVCNRYGAGRAVDYRIGLIARIGIERVEALEHSNAVHKWTKDELIAITQVYRTKLKEMQE